MIDKIRIQSRAAHEHALDLRARFTHERARTHATFAWLRSAEHPQKTKIVFLRRTHLVARALAAIMLGERTGVFAQRLYAVAIVHRRALAANALHQRLDALDRKSTRLNSSHVKISYAVVCLKK